MRRPRSATAVVVASVVLALGVAGGGYAAGMITGADIKDGTVTSADLKNGTVTSQDIKDRTVRLGDLAPATVDGLSQGPRAFVSEKGPGAFFPAVPALTVFHTMTVPAGIWLVSVTATAFPHDTTAFADAQCYLKTADASSLVNRVAFPSLDAYGTVATQLVVHAIGDTDVNLACDGSNFGINNVTMTAVEAGTITDVSP